MAKRFSILQNATFKSKVSVPRIGGEPIEIEFEYKYLSRKELAALYQSWQEAQKELVESEIKDLIELTDADIKMQVGQLKDILVGWSFEDEFSDENIAALVETSVHASRVITEAYGEAYSKAKLGN
jgi:Phage tail assembly chaperone